MAKRTGKHGRRRAHKAKVHTLSLQRAHLAFEPLEVRQVLALTPTTISLVSSSQSVVYGTPITLTATVETVPANSPVVSTGTVAFMDGATTLGTSAVSMNTATLSNVVLPASGVNSLSASYSGSAGTNLAGSTTQVTPNSVILTVAGAGDVPGSGGQATGTDLYQPYGVAVDSVGDIFIADTYHNLIREVNHATGVITTIAGTGLGGYGGDGGQATAAEINFPVAVALDSAGDIFIAEQEGERVREVNAQTGIITTVAGNGSVGYNGDGEQATAAELFGVSGLAVDSPGNVYISEESGCRVREVNRGTGIITTVAGNGTYGYTGDGGQATAAELNYPQGIALDSSGDLFIADQSNASVREVNRSTGTITTIAGTGTSGTTVYGFQATASQFLGPDDVAVDSSGNVFIVDNGAVSEVNHASGVVSLVAGGSVFRGFSGDGGPATAAELNVPRGVAIDSMGDVFIADLGNDRIREVNAASGIITTIAGNGTIDYSGDGGPASTAELASDSSVAVDSAGDIFISDGDHIRKVNHSTGIITSVAGNGITGYAGDGGPATAAELDGAQAVAIDSVGDIFIADGQRIREVNHTTGIISTLTGNGTAGYSGDGGPATTAELDNPDAIAVDSSGNIFIADAGNNRVREVNYATGIITTVAGDATRGYSGDGGEATAAELSHPTGIAVDTAGDIFISDTLNNRVREVNHLTGIITTVAGNGASNHSGDGGEATAASLFEPQGLALDSSGDIFIADMNNNCIRELNQSTGVITTVAGSGTWVFGGDGGPASSAGLDSPQSVALDTSGDLFIADTADQRVREVLAGGALVALTQAAPNLAVTDTGGTYNGSAYPATATLDGSASLDGVTPTLSYYSGTAATGTALSGAPSTAGTYTALANFAGSSDYTSAAASATFTIAQATVELNLSDSGGTYKGSAYAASASVAGIGSQSAPATSLEGVAPTLNYYSGGAATGTTLSGTPSSAGTYTALASFAGSTDYSAATASVTFTINKATPEITVADGGGAYQGAAFNAVESVAGVGSQSTPASSLEGVAPKLVYYSGTAASGTALAGAPSAAGAYTVVASFNGSADYISAQSNSVSFSIIMPTTISLSSSAQIVAYGATIALTATVDTVPANSPVLSVGNVTFTDGTIVLGTVSVSSNTATLNGVLLTDDGVHYLKASYSGSASNYIARQHHPGRSQLAHRDCRGQLASAW